MSALGRMGQADWGESSVRRRFQKQTNIDNRNHKLDANHLKEKKTQNNRSNILNAIYEHVRV